MYVIHCYSTHSIAKLKYFENNILKINIKKLKKIFLDYINFLTPSQKIETESKRHIHLGSTNQFNLHGIQKSYLKFTINLVKKFFKYLHLSKTLWLLMLARLKFERFENYSTLLQKHYRLQAVKCIANVNK